MTLGLLRRYPLFIPALGLSLGIYSAASYPVFANFGFWTWGFLAVCYLFFWRCRKHPASLLLLLLSFFLLGALRFGDRAFRPPPENLASWVEERKNLPLYLEAEEYCQSEGNLSRFHAKVLGYFDGPVLKPFPLRILVKVGSPNCPAAPGRRFQVWGRFAWPKRFRNPFSFDYPLYLRLQNIPATFFVKAERFFLPWGEGPSGFSEFAAGLREHLLARLRLYLEPGPSRGVLEALVVGEEGGLTKETQDTFRRTGLTHLLVVSGLHLTMVFFLFFGPLYFLFSLRESWSNGGFARKAAMVAAWLPTAFYAAVVGPGPSVWRALTFAGVAVLVFLQDWKRDVFSVLLLSFVVYLCADPGALFDLSFQFSYLAVATLAFSGKKAVAISRRTVARKFVYLQKAGTWLGVLLFINLAVNLAVLPRMTQAFQEASLVAPLANLAAVPFFTLCIHPLSWIAVLLEPLSSPLAAWLLRFLASLLKQALSFLQWISDRPGAAVLVAPLPWPFWCGYGVLVFALFIHPRWPRRLLLGASFLMLVALGIREARREDNSGMLTLTAIDVGQGDSLLLQSPEGRALLIDGGGFPYSDFDVGRAVVLPELLGRRIGNLRALVLTHPDADHLRGLLTIAEHWPVEELWYAAVFESHLQFQALRQKALEKGIELRPLRLGDHLAEGEVDFEVLWPGPEADVSGSDNDLSLVLRACYHKVCFLLTGDLEQEGENGVNPSPLPEGLRILKVAHHGSRSSSSFDFLRKVQPHLALVSAGKENRFGFPHPEVVRRFAERNVPLLRTDLLGQIVIQSDGERIKYHGFSGEVGTLTTLGLFPNWWFSSR